MFGFRPHIESMAMLGIVGSGWGGRKTATSESKSEEGPGAPYKPVPNNPGLYYIPGTNYVVQYETDDFGRVTTSPLPLTVGKALLGTAGVETDGSGSGRMASDDPRYWQLQYDQLTAQYTNMGLDAESARRQALTTLITNRNNTAADTANVSANVAKTAAEFAANPRDAVAELMYRNQVGGTTPFGDMTNDNFGAYGKALAEKAASIFQPVSRDIDQLRNYRDSIPQTEFFGPETRSQLGLQPTPAQALTGAGGQSSTSLPVSNAAPFDPMAALTAARAGAGSDANFLEGLKRYAELPKAAEGGKVNALDFNGMFDGRAKEGFSPSSSEGGMNLNIHERAVIVGESGKVYGTLGEKRPDGTVRAEQLMIKPLKSEVAKDKKLEEANKAKTETQGKFLANFSEGGTATSTPDDFMQQLSQLLGSYGGSGGGTGAYSTPLPSLRLLAGAPMNALEDDPDALEYAKAGYSALGISPNNFLSTLKKYTPKSAQLVGQTSPRVNFL